MGSAGGAGQRIGFRNRLLVLINWAWDYSADMGGRAREVLDRYDITMYAAFMLGGLDETKEVSSRVRCDR